MKLIVFVSQNISFDHYGFKWETSTKHVFIRLFKMTTFVYLEPAFFSACGVVNNCLTGRHDDSNA